MNPIPRQLVIEVWERQCVLGENETLALMKQFFDEQPALGVYLLVCDEQLDQEVAQNQLIPLAATIWEAATRTRGKRLKAVRPKIIEHAEAANTRMLEKLEDVSEFEWRETVAGMFLGYHQQPLLAFCIEILMANDEEVPELPRNGLGWN